MHDEVKEIPASTPNFRTELAEKLAELVPEVMADGKIDTRKLEELLDGDAADTKERFGLFWPGKKRALRAAQEPTTATLVPDKKNSKDWGTTQNVFIEGDNLEVLKILQKHYHGKIKMIYIDPPYNTGQDFVYPDNYREGLKTYLEFTQQVDSGGRKLSTNSDQAGRYHSNWLNMMYPRLKLARNLLTRNGVVFISIDEHEVAQLRRLCDEVFGEGCFVGQFVWTTKNAARGVPPRSMLMENHEYILAYSRSPESVKFKGLPRDKADFSNPDNDPRGLWRSESMKATGAQDNYFTVENPVTGHEFYANWAFSEERVREMISDGLVLFPEGGSGTPRQKKFMDSYLNERKAFVTSLGWFSTENSTKALMKLFGGKKIFDFPKPVDLVKFFVDQATADSDIVLDFFSGSATTAQAVWEANVEDGETRRQIQVQLPEPLEANSVAAQLGFKTVADIARERMARVAGSITSPDIDTGFRTYKLADTNFSKWQMTSNVAETELEQHLLGLRESADDQASQDSLLTELLLKRGYSLTEHVDELNIAGLGVRGVQDVEGDYGLLAYLNEDQKPTIEQLRALVDAAEAQIIMLEDAFQGDDQLKTNLTQLCRSQGIELWTA